MTDPLLDRIRAGYSAWNQGDLDKTLEFLHPDVEWRTSASFPGVEPLYEGHEGFKRFWEHLHAPFEDVRVSIQSYEREGDVAMLRIRFEGRSAESGVEMDLPWFQAMVLEDEKIKRSALDRSVSDALEALDVGDAFPEF